MVDSSSQLVWNISYAGTILFYGQRSVFILDESLQMFKATVMRPVYVVEPVPDR